ncbi:putative MYND domain protein [Westerdykella ornata]|uniref:Putative MYND domain protein n=1 Tax=Westerdykella ornata TaxID=318751 RepID=A0A6A6JTJ3_WESOR|nr:putative MYND domain protein [Westerdykella ornata]KAF2279931.1 putative MYND domain protein [Westerdykella ornata]
MTDTAAAAQAPLAETCRVCKKTGSALRRCAQCHSAAYCSRRCQRRDWKQHKENCQPASEPVGCGDVCFNSTNERSSDSTQNPSSKPKPLEKTLFKPFNRLDNGTYLHDRPKQDVYKLLIDTFRLRENDDYEFEGYKQVGIVYKGATHSLEPFRRFLRLAESRTGLLPSWWNGDARKECEELGMQTEQGNWSSLKHRVAKRDIIKRYEDDLTMPMQLRMLGGLVYRREVMGADATSMLRMMVSRENGQVPYLSMFSM